jgi:hypothetical protein
VIRPFVFVREKNLRQFAEGSNLPVISENCPACFEAPKVSDFLILFCVEHCLVRRSIKMLASVDFYYTIQKSCNDKYFACLKERHRTKQLLAQQEILFPRLMLSLRSAMMPLMSVQKTGVESTLFARRRASSSSSDGAASDDDTA